MSITLYLNHEYDLFFLRAFKILTSYQQFGNGSL